MDTHTAQVILFSDMENLHKQVAEMKQAHAHRLQIYHSDPNQFLPGSNLSRRQCVECALRHAKPKSANHENLWRALSTCDRNNFISSQLDKAPVENDPLFIPTVQLLLALARNKLISLIITPTAYIQGDFVIRQWQRWLNILCPLMGNVFIFDLCPKVAFYDQTSIHYET